jgi:hypothetical protein
MIILKALIFIFILALGGAVAYVLVADVPTPQTEVVKTIPAEGLINAE